MSEADEQIAVVDYCDLHDIPVFHIPNGGKRNRYEAAHLKRQGVKPGIPDLCIPMPNKNHHALYIEMKQKGGHISQLQTEWIMRLRDYGNAAFVCFGADNAIACIESYIRGEI